MPPWESCSQHALLFSAKSEVLIFFLGKLGNSFRHACETTNITWHELICLMEGYICTHTIGISLTNMWINTLIFPEISANEELLSAWGNIVLLQIRDGTGIGLKISSWKYLTIYQTVLTFSRSTDSLFLFWKLNWFKRVSKVRDWHGHNLILVQEDGKCPGI